MTSAAFPRKLDVTCERFKEFPRELDFSETPAVFSTVLDVKLGLDLSHKPEVFPLRDENDEPAGPSNEPPSNDELEVLNDEFSKSPEILPSWSLRSELVSNEVAGSDDSPDDGVWRSPGLLPLNKDPGVHVFDSSRGDPLSDKLLECPCIRGVKI